MKSVLECMEQKCKVKGTSARKTFPKKLTMAGKEENQSKKKLKQKKQNKADTESDKEYNIWVVCQQDFKNSRFREKWC